MQLKSKNNEKNLNAPHPTKCLNNDRLNDSIRAAGRCATSRGCTPPYYCLLLNFSFSYRQCLRLKMNSSKSKGILPLRKS